MYLTNGFSSQRGICLVGRGDSRMLAAYAFRKDGRIECVAGPQEDVRAEFLRQRKADELESDKGLGKVALMVAVPIAIIVVAAVLAANMFQVVGVAAFAILAAFPCYALSLVGENYLTSDDLFQQLRRHHGAEHMLFDFTRKNKDRLADRLVPQDLQGCSYLDRECGTVWMATIILWAAALGVGIAMVPAWGTFGCIKVVAGATVVLMVNMYLNPANPLKAFQKREVAPPTLAELEVAVAAYNALNAAFAQTEDARPQEQET